MGGGLEGLKVAPGEAVGIIAAQSVGESITQQLLRSIHLAGSESKAAAVLPRLIAILDANRNSEYTRDIFSVYDESGIEAARNSIIEELSQILSINRRHLMLIADMMTVSGVVMALGHSVSGKKSVLARAMFMRPMKELIGAASSGETDMLSGTSERIAVGLLAPHGTGSVRLQIQDEDFAGKNTSLWKLPFEERELPSGYLQIAKNVPLMDAREREPIEYDTENKALGCALPWKKEIQARIRDRKLRKAMERHLFRGRLHYADENERRFAYALPLLDAYWGILSAHRSVRKRSAWIYRECIKRDITKGRALKEMVPACIIVAYAMNGIDRPDIEALATGSDLWDEIVELTVGMGARPGRIYGNCRKMNQTLRLDILGLR